MLPISVWADGSNQLAEHLSIDDLQTLWMSAAHAASDPGCSAYMVERLADQQVILEAAAAAISQIPVPPLDGDSSAGTLLKNMTRWRVYRDVAQVSASLQLLIGETAPRWAPEGWVEEDDAIAAGVGLEKGTAMIIADSLRQISTARSSSYLAPVLQSIEETAVAVEKCVAEDFLGSGEHVKAGLAWILDPLSSLHTSAAMTARAIVDEESGDRRASTVVRRWAYARVRSHSAEGLSRQHSAKSKLLVAGLSIG